MNFVKNMKTIRKNMPSFWKSQSPLLQCHSLSPNLSQNLKRSQLQHLNPQPNPNLLPNQSPLRKSLRETPLPLF